MPASVSRRELMKWASAGAGAAAVGGATWLVGRDDADRHAPDIAAGDDASPRETAAPRTPDTAPTPVSAIADLGQRLLVVVEMDGGNDGMSTLVPYGMGAYYDLRQRTAVSETDVLQWNDQVGLHSKLANINRRGAAVLQGVGSSAPDGSHFEMQARWWSGDPLDGRSFDTGFLGRLADAIGDPAAAAVAVSVGSGTHPALSSKKVGTLAIPNADAIGYIVGAADDDPLRQAFQRGFASFGEARSGGFEELLRAVRAQTVKFAGAIGEFDEEGDGGFPSSSLGQGLRLAAQLLSIDLGVRIVHVPMNEDFDTHDDHPGRHPALLESFDASLEAFFTDLETRGLSDRVLVMTTSEFGRTAHDNASAGLDHGTASVAMLIGPVNPGLYGEHPSLTELDENDDLIATMGFDQYYASVAEGWFGVPAGDLLNGAPSPIEGLFA
ncbi:MAG: DUF1501 domain-containing protein [Ilumatobacteraceae bacterium]